MQTTTDVTNKEQGFFGNIVKQPLKITLVVGLSLVLSIIGFVVIRRCYKCYHSLSVTNQAYDAVIGIGKFRPIN